MREEIYELRELRHPNLVHFVGICYVLDGIGLITGNYKGFHKVNNNEK